MVTTSMIDSLKYLLQRAGAELTIRQGEDGNFYYVADEFEPARQRLANYDAVLTSEIETLSRKVTEMADEPVDAFWKLTDTLLAADPKLHPSDARKLAMSRHPDLAQLAGVPGAGRAKRQSKAPPGNSAHYAEAFMALSYAYESAHGCSDQVARLTVARENPDLRAAAFGGDAKSRFFQAAGYENRVNKLDLAQAYRAVAGFLPADAMEVL